MIGKPSASAITRKRWGPASARSWAKAILCSAVAVRLLDNLAKSIKLGLGLRHWGHFQPTPPGCHCTPRTPGINPEPGLRGGGGKPRAGLRDVAGSAGCFRPRSPRRHSLRSLGWRRDRLSQRFSLLNIPHHPAHTAAPYLTLSYPAGCFAECFRDLPARASRPSRSYPPRRRYGPPHPAQVDIGYRVSSSAV